MKRNLDEARAHVADLESRAEKAEVRLRTVRERLNFMITMPQVSEPLPKWASLRVVEICELSFVDGAPVDSVCGAPSGFSATCTLPKDHGDVHSWARPSEARPSGFDAFEDRARRWIREDAEIEHNRANVEGLAWLLQDEYNRGFAAGFPARAEEIARANHEGWLTGMGLAAGIVRGDGHEKTAKRIDGVVEHCPKDDAPRPCTTEATPEKVCLYCRTGITDQERDELRHLRQRNRDMHDRAQKAETELARQHGTDYPRNETKFTIEGESPRRPVSWRAVGPWRSDFRMAQSDAERPSHRKDYTLPSEVIVVVATARELLKHGAIDDECSYAGRLETALSAYDDAVDLSKETCVFCGKPWHGIHSCPATETDP